MAKVALGALPLQTKFTVVLAFALTTLEGLMTPKFNVEVAELNLQLLLDRTAAVTVNVFVPAAIAHPAVRRMMRAVRGRIIF